MVSPTVAPSSVFKPQRLAEPPAFWITLLVASVLIHGLFFLILRQTWMKTARVQVDVAPIAVELLESAPEAGSSQSNGTPITAPAASASAPSAPTEPIAPPDNTAERSPAQQAPFAAAPAQSDVTAAPVPQRQPAPDNTTAAPATSQSLPATNSPTPEPSAGTEPQPQSPAPSPVTGEASSTPPTAAPDPTPAAPGAGTEPSPGNSPSSEVGRPQLPVVPVTAQRGEGGGIKIMVLDVTDANQGRDVTDVGERAIARPQVTSQPLPDIVYPASIELNLGQSVQLLVLVDRSGNAKAIEVLQGSKVEDLDNLAKELIQKIQFEPALQAGQPVESLVNVTVRIDPL